MLDAKQESSYKWGMNKLPLEKRVQILHMLCEGMAMRAISRACDVSVNTVSKLLVDAGNATARRSASARARRGSKATPI